MVRQRRKLLVRSISRLRTVALEIQKTCNKRDIHQSVAKDRYLYEDEEINFCISDTDLNKLTKTSCKIKKIFGLKKKMSKTEFEHQVKKLYKCSLKSIKDLYELHLRRVVGMKLFNDIIRRVNPNYIDISHVIHMTWAIMSCIHHFQLRLKPGSGGLVQYTRRKKAKSCMKSFSRFIRLFKAPMYRVILNAIITFYKEGQLWEIEFICTDLILELLCIYEDIEVAVNDIISNAEHASVVDLMEARQLIQVLYEVLKRIEWHKLSRALMRRLLNIMDSSIIPKSSDKFNYVPLRKGIQLCLRHIMDNLRNRDLIVLLPMALRKITSEDVDDEITVEFGFNIAAYAASKCRFKVFYKNIPMSIITTLVSLGQSKNNLQVAASIRIWQNLIDRNRNSSKFIPPRIYFEDTKYNIIVNKCVAEDKLFFKSFQALHFEISLEIWKTAQNRRALENVFMVQATILSEIPCSLTASTHVTLAMCLQEYAFSVFKTDLVRSHHLHAMVLSLMSLICYINRAKVFYAYVNTIMERRAEWAPHLNPPLREKYAYAQHHVLWNKPDLFFEDWEARYGLWKCFRTKQRYKNK